MKDANGHPTHPSLELFAHQPWACQFAEGAPNGPTRSDNECRGCVLANGANVVNGAYWPGSHPITGELVDPADYYEQHRHKHGLPPLPERRSACGQSCG